MNVRWRYFIAGCVLFLVEVFIALYVNDAIIRPHIGDLLVVIMIYCFAKAVLNTRSIPTAIGTLLFAYAIEVLQYFKIVRLLGLEQFAVARIVIGTSFSWIDIFCYTLGIALVLIIEKLRKRK